MMMLHGMIEIINVGFEVISFASTVAFLPVFILFICLCHLYKVIHERVVLSKTEGDAAIVRGNDSVWLQDSPENRAIINTLIRPSKHIDVEELKGIFTSKILCATNQKGQMLFPKLASYIIKILHSDVWIQEEDFDVSEHIYVWSETIADNKADVSAVVGQLASQSLPSKKSPWQVVVIPTASTHATGKDGCYLMVRVHHSVADGISLMKIVMQHLFNYSGQQEGKRRYATKKSVGQVCQMLLQAPAMIIKKLLLRCDKHALHGPKLTGTKRVAWSDPIDFDLIKHIKSRMPDTTINDILMSCMGRAFREYFSFKGDDIPGYIKAYIPVDVRSPSAKDKLDNQFALVFMKLPVQESDPVEHLLKTKQTMDQIKSSQEALLIALFMNFCMERLPNSITQFFFDLMANKCSVVLSNVPGPREQVQLCGVPVDEIAFWPPQKYSIGIGVSIMTYNNNVSLGVLADTSLMDKPSVLVDMFAKQIHVLSEALQDKVQH